MSAAEEPKKTLRSEKALLENLIESVLDGILIVSPEREVLYFNRQFVEIWQLSADILQSGLDDVMVHAAAQRTADPEGFLSRVAELYANPFRAPVREELKMKDGRVLDRFGGSIRKAGAHYGWVWIFRDITERKQAEQALRESEQNLREQRQLLETKVTERTATLEEHATRLRHLAVELASTEQRERKRLAALLHEDLQQILVAATMRLAAVRNRMQEESNRQSVDQAIEWIKEATDSARDLTHQLCPPALYEDGLIAALHWLFSHFRKHHHLAVTLKTANNLKPLKDDVNALLFDCIQELLFNIVTYARVEEACVSVFEESHELRIVVEDKGQGFDATAEGPEQHGGFGLFSIRQRLLALGGDMKIKTSKGRGTRVELAIPLSFGAAEPKPSSQ